MIREMRARSIRTGIVYPAFYSVERDTTTIHLPYGTRSLNREQFNEQYRYTATGVIAPKPKQFTHRTQRGG